MNMNNESLKSIIEAALLAAGEPLTMEKLLSLFEEHERPTTEAMQAALAVLEAECVSRPVELKELASGYCLQVKFEYARWISRLWEERPGKYSKAFLETLALVAYRQPITRAEIEDVRGVSVSSNILKTLQEREWIRIVGHRDVPGRPSLYATTRRFLDYFNLKSLDELPTLSELRDFDKIEIQLPLESAASEEKIPLLAAEEEITELAEA